MHVSASCSAPAGQGEGAEWASGTPAAGHPPPGLRAWDGLPLLNFQIHWGVACACRSIYKAAGMWLSPPKGASGNRLGVPRLCLATVGGANGVPGGAHRVRAGEFAGLPAAEVPVCLRIGPCQTRAHPPPPQARAERIARNRAQLRQLGVRPLMCLTCLDPCGAISRPSLVPSQPACRDSL